MKEKIEKLIFGLMLIVHECKAKLKRTKLNIFTVLLISCFLYNGYNVYSWIKDSRNVLVQISTILDSINVNEVEDGENTVVIDQNYTIPKDNMYWQYIKTNYIDVNMSELLASNKDTVGWIKLEGTNINYPIVQSNDNEYYLNRAFDLTENSAGWVFADYRNNVNLFDRNLIIYGHSRLDGTMFGTLKNIITNGWLDNSENHMVKLSTLTENSVWQVFSVYKIPVTTDYLRVSFNDSSFLEFGQMLLNRSEHDFDTHITSTDKILTLSTCSTGNNRVVMHAKLIKSEAK